MSANAGLGKLKQAAKDLRVQWDETRGAWRDENCEQFEERVITPLLNRVRTVELALGHMAAVLQQVRHDCE
jgi:hypothetical protein